MDLDNLCDCRVPMSARCLPMDDRDGRDVMVVIAKMTYAVDSTGTVALARPPTPIRIFDVAWSDAAEGSIRYPSDLCEEKPGTDILLIGSAFPPNGRSETEQLVKLCVETRFGAITKTVKVYGTRVWQRGLLGVVPGPPAPLRKTPLIYELTYGGCDAEQPRMREPRNPVGMGYAVDRTRLVGYPAPQIEDPVAPLSSSNPAPAGFGPLCTSWEPRVSRAGVMDAAWRREHAPLRPPNFDQRFHSVAPPGLWSEIPLLGDEPVEVLGATPQGIWRFRLPRFVPKFRAVMRREVIDLPTHLDTYLIDADEGRVELTWRARVPIPRRVAMLESMQVLTETPLPESIIEQAMRHGSAAPEGVLAS